MSRADGLPPDRALPGMPTTEKASDCSGDAGGPSAGLTRDARTAIHEFAPSPGIRMCIGRTRFDPAREIDHHDRGDVGHAEPIACDMFRLAETPIERLEEFRGTCQTAMDRIRTKQDRIEFVLPDLARKAESGAAFRLEGRFSPERLNSRGSS